MLPIHRPIGHPNRPDMRPDYGQLTPHAGTQEMWNYSMHFVSTNREKSFLAFELALYAPCGPQSARNPAPKTPIYPPRNSKADLVRPVPRSRQFSLTVR